MPGLGGALGSVDVILSSNWSWKSLGSLLLSNLLASKLTCSDLPPFTKPEISVLKARKVGFSCSHNLLDILSIGKCQLLKSTSKINFFVFWISLSHFFPDVLKVECLTPGHGRWIYGAGTSSLITPTWDRPRIPEPLHRDIWHVSANRGFWSQWEPSKVHSQPEKDPP